MITAEIQQELLRLGVTAEVLHLRFWKGYKVEIRHGRQVGAYDGAQLLAKLRVTQGDVWMVLMQMRLDLPTLL